MRKSLALTPVFLFSALAAAQGINPSAPRSAPVAPADIFRPAKSATPPAPPPLPIAVREGSAPKLAGAPATVPTPIREFTDANRPCAIQVTGAATAIIPPGGSFILQVNDDGRGRSCVTGISSSDPWLQIRHFNGRELALFAEPNTTGGSRRAQLVFANATDSVTIDISQSAP